MKTQFLAGLVAGALTAAGSTTAFAQGCSGTVTEQDVLQAEDARYAAQMANDFAAMDQLFGDDLVYTHTSAVTDGKASYTDSMRSGNVKYRVMRRSDVKVRTFGCVGVLTGQGDFDVTVKGQDLSVALRFTSVWARRGDALQFVSWESTRIPPKQ
jgi:ketosteroid isomerase-like protein